MTSVERIVEYCNLEPEAPRETDTKPPDDWPSKGQIEFNKMSFRYHKSLPRVLHGITCCIKPSEKVFFTQALSSPQSHLFSIRVLFSWLSLSQDAPYLLTQFDIIAARHHCG